MNVNIKWVPGLASEKKDKVRKEKGLKRLSQYEILEKELGWEVCELPPGLVKKDIEWLNDHPNVELAEPEGFGEATPFETGEGTASSVEAFNEWYQTFVKTLQAHTKTKGAGVTVAVLDNGVNINHPWLAGRIVEQKIFDMVETDFGGGSHGTPVTGLIFAIGPDLKATNYKIAGSDVRCSWNDVAVALLYAKDRVPVINLSWGGGSSFTLGDAILKVRQAGVALFVSAGNSANATQFPAYNTNAIAVSALDINGLIAGFSCRGKIEIGSPGVSLLTTSGDGWGHFSGTSGASPIAAAVCALVVALTGKTGREAAEYMLSMARKQLPAEHYGFGLLDAGAATGATEPVGFDTTPPTAPQNLRFRDVTPTDFLFEWDASTDDVGVMLYELFGGDYKFEQTSATSMRINRVLNTGSRLRVRAVDAAGNMSPLSEYLNETGIDPTPPPEETWEAVSEVYSIVYTEWTPSGELYFIDETVVQERIKTTTWKNYEKSNLGNERNIQFMSSVETEGRSISGTKERPNMSDPINLITQPGVSWSARGEHPTSGFGPEGIAQLFDGNKATKWLDFAKITWVRINLPNAATLKSYDITSANDAPQRDPKNWSLYGSNDGVAWTLIETVVAPIWASRFEKKSFSVSSEVAYKHFKFDLECVSGDINQLAELVLFGVVNSEPVEETWAALREVSSITHSEWEPSAELYFVDESVNQTRTKTTIWKNYEKSNLGNERNVSFETQTETENQTVSGLKPRSSEKEVLLADLAAFKLEVNQKIAEFEIRVNSL